MRYKIEGYVEFDDENEMVETLSNDYNIEDLTYEKEED